MLKYEFHISSTIKADSIEMINVWSKLTSARVTPADSPPHPLPPGVIMPLTADWLITRCEPQTAV
jgi:hypothetical protein